MPELSLYRYVCLEGNSAPCPSDGIHGYKCPSGFYCPAGTGLELPCEPGTFSPVPGASVCLPCPAGTACSNAATVKPLGCPRGEQYMCAAKLQHANGKRYDGCQHNSFWLSHSSGLLQSTGYLPLVRASSAFPPLSPFFFQQCLTHLFQCTGYYCPVRTAVPLPCPEGTLNTLEGAVAPTACKLCPVGRYCRGDANWEPDGEFG